MNLFDVLVIALLLIAVIIGARAGFLGPILGLAGAAAGFGTAIVLADVAQPALAEIDQPLRALIALLGLGFLVITGEILGGGLGAAISRRAHPAWMQPIDLVGGGLVGIAHGVLLLWLLGGMLAAGLAPGLARLAQGSVALALVSEATPSPSLVAGELVSLFEATGLPRLFHGLEPPPAPPVDLPDDAQARALAESGLPSTARVEASGCGPQVQVGSAFFVSSDRTVTNAHVVAGADGTTITYGGTSFSATVVLFDPDMDLALLHVPGAGAPALQLSEQAPERGQVAVALGFPGGGPLSATPAAVTASYEATGPDIYGRGRVQRSIVEMRAGIVQGNSGGPLVTAPGVAGGVVFGGSRAEAGVGYAISAPVAASRIAPGLATSSAVDTGPCR